MRSIKYSPLISTLNSIKYIKNLINYSFQKIYTIDMNVVMNKNKDNYEEKSENVNKLEMKLSFDGLTQKQMIGSENDFKIINNNQLKESQSESFEAVMSEWSESPNNDSVKESKPLAKVKSSSLPVMTKSKIEVRTKQLIESLTTSSSHSSMSTILRLQELNKHLVAFPDSMTVSVNHKAIQRVLQLRQWSDNRIIKSHSMQTLSLLGYCDPPKGRGIRILSIDGGGTRGLIVIEILREIEKLTGKRIYELFDLICGVSTGAILGMLLGALQTPIDDCERYYHKFSSHLFKSDFFRGAGRLIWTHSYYDTTVWEKVLREIYSETDLIETKQGFDCPHILAISAIMNKPSIQAYLFRNYELPLTKRSMSQYEGSSGYKIWQSVRASAAAPGFFQEFTLNNYIHQDGGLLINNPIAVAIHEAKLLWPYEQIQCVLSLGSGRHIPPNLLKPDDISVSPTSWKNKIIRLIDSATDTEMVHRLMQDLLPNRSYYRLNPNLTDSATLDENRPEKLEQMKNDAQMYLRKNHYKVDQAVKELTKTRKPKQKLDDWLGLQYKLRI